MIPCFYTDLIDGHAVSSRKHWFLRSSLTTLQCHHHFNAWGEGVLKTDHPKRPRLGGSPRPLWPGSLSQCVAKSPVFTTPALGFVPRPGFVPGPWVCTVRPGLLGLYRTAIKPPRLLKRPVVFGIRAILSSCRCSLQKKFV